MISESPKPEKKRKRGRTKCKKVSKCKEDGIKKNVSTDSIGNHVGDEAPSLSSFVGLTVKNVVPCCMVGWKKVDEGYKNRIWEIILMAYDLNESWRRKITKLVGLSLKNWRYELKKRFVTPRENSPDLYIPPTVEYPQIQPEHWVQFVKNCIDPKAKEFSDLQRERSEHNQYYSTTGRSGYAMLRQAMADKGILNPPRHVVWVEGGAIKTQMRAFGKPPPQGRGVTGGRFATMDTFFETCQLRSDIETGRLKRELAARDEELANERQRNIELERQHTEMVNQLSNQSSPTIENVSNSNPGPSRTLQLLAPSFTSQEAPQNDSSRPHPYARPEQVLYNTEPPHHPGGPAKVDSRRCLLAVDTPTNFIAFGNWYGDGGNGMTIHGATLPHGMCKVVVNDIIANQENTLVPKPTYEVRTLHEVINNFIMWPSLLVSFNLETLNSRPVQKDVQKPVIPLPTGRYSLLALRRRISSFPDLGIAYQAPIQVFGYQVGYVVIMKTDIEEMLRTKMNEKLQQEGEQHLYGFAMPGAIAPSGNIELESDCLARSLTSFRSPDRLTFVPFVHNEHWYLIIINPEFGRYYWLESHNLLTVTDEAKALVRRAIKKYHVHFASPPPAITYQVIRVPQQLGGTECGYYLMMVMEYIIRNRLTEFHCPLIPNKKSYKPIELNIVKEIIAREVLHLWDNMS
ncbi:hypothetical protein ACFE04_008436 [Oxalis oulophora]